MRPCTLEKYSDSNPFTATFDLTFEYIELIITQQFASYPKLAKF